MIIQSAQQQSKGQIPLQRHETTWLSLQLVAVTRPSFNAVLPLKAARPQSFSALITRFGHPSSDYYRGWKVRNYINIRLQSSLSRFSFETEQHNYRKYDKKFGAPTTGLRRSCHHLIYLSSLLAHWGPWNEPEKFVDIHQFRICRVHKIYGHRCVTLTFDTVTLKT